MRKRILAAILLATILVSAFALLRATTMKNRFFCKNRRSENNRRKRQRHRTLRHQSRRLACSGKLACSNRYRKRIRANRHDDRAGKQIRRRRHARTFGRIRRQLGERDRFSTHKSPRFELRADSLHISEFRKRGEKVGDRYERTPYEELKVDESKFARLDWAIEMCKNIRFTQYSICTAQSVRKAATTIPAT